MSIMHSSTVLAQDLMILVPCFTKMIDDIDLGTELIDI